jgi:DNA-binding beta-propeller fold protein YncE
VNALSTSRRRRPRAASIARRVTVAATSVALVVAAAGCGGDDSTGDATAATAATTTESPSTTVAVSDPPDTTNPPTTVDEVDDETWRAEVDAACSHGVGVFSIPEPGGDAESLEAFVAAHREIHETGPSTGSIRFEGPGRTPDDLREITAGMDEALDRAAEAAAAGDYLGTWEWIHTMRSHNGFLASAYASEGQSCGPADAQRAAEAALNVSILSPWQVEVGFDSVWVSQRWSDTVLRIDSETGEVLARIEMPSRPVKLQPADGAMVVRTATSYEMVDAATNTIVASLLKTDVGPEANLSWAVDGALWICDGRRLHRYDPATLTPVALIDLDVDCGQVYATADLAIPWSYNEDPGESGASRAAFIDPATNSVIATVDLAADAGVPVVLDDVVFFPPLLGTQASVIDRSTWTVTSAPDLGRFFDGGSQPAFDGTSIYVIAEKLTGTIAVIDPTTFEVTGELLAVGPDLNLNSLAATPGTLWAVNQGGGLLQRFDTGS